MLKYVLTLLLITIIACNNKADDRIEFVEVFTTNGEADSATHYNKGMAIDRFLHLDYKTDSIYFIDRENYFIAKTKLNRRALIDSIKNFVSIVNQKKADSFYCNFNRELEKLYLYYKYIDYESPGVAYCGPPSIQIIIQRKSRRQHYDLYYMGDEYYNDIFQLLEYGPFDSAIKTDKFPFEFDKEKTAVEFYKKVGVFDRIRMPYFPKFCNPGTVNPEALVGTWRFVYPNGQYNDPGTFTTVTYLSDGSFYYQSYNDGKSKVRDNRWKGAYKLNSNNDLFLMNYSNVKVIGKLKLLNDSCMIQEFENRTEYLNRY